MANNTASIQEQMTYSAILQIASVIVCIIIIFTLILPKMQQISAQTEKTNKVIQAYEETEKNGISFSNLKTIIPRVGNNTELQEIINANEEASKEAIQKKDVNETTTYLQWLAYELRDKEKNEEKIRKAREKINTILPTLSPISGGIEENNIKLGDYIEFMEAQILRKFSLESTSPLGITSIQYGEKEKNMVNPIGYFDTSIAFQGRNENIIDMLDYLYKSGNPEILTSSENIDISEQYASTKLANPLIVVEAFALDKPLNAHHPKIHNSGRITLRMYIRGASKTDKQFLTDTFNKRKNALLENLESQIKTCTTSDTPCSKLHTMKDLKKRTEELSENITKNTNESVEGIYFIGQQIDSLKVIEQEFETHKLN